LVEVYQPTLFSSGDFWDFTALSFFSSPACGNQKLTHKQKSKRCSFVPPARSERFVEDLLKFFQFQL
jgi:hypothetical protein